MPSIYQFDYRLAYASKSFKAIAAMSLSKKLLTSYDESFGQFPNRTYEEEMKTWDMSTNTL